jgi:hypothetical protein
LPPLWSYGEKPMKPFLKCKGTLKPQFPFLAKSYPQKIKLLERQKVSINIIVAFRAQYY